jgi:hypothetical protein
LPDRIPETDQEACHSKTGATNQHDHQDGDDPWADFFWSTLDLWRRAADRFDHELKTGVVHERQADA